MKPTHLKQVDIVLDEFVNRLDPLPWYAPQVSSLTLPKLHQIVLDLVERGLIRRVGVAHRVWQDGEKQNDILYGPTTEGVAVWEADVKGRRPPSAAQATFPKFTGAQLVVAVSPCDVFDLPRVPWRHKLKRDLE